jgi:pyrroloquinoline quinone biosynthesis protein D
METMSAPRLKPGVKLRDDPVRGTILLAPERFLALDEIAYAIVRRIDGRRETTTIAEELAQEFDANTQDILSDVEELLGQLSAQGYVAR